MPGFVVDNGLTGRDADGITALASRLALLISAAWSREDLAFSLEPRFKRARVEDYGLHALPLNNVVGRMSRDLVGDSR